MENNMENTRLIPVNEWQGINVWPSTAALRFMIVKADENGFDEFGVVKRIRRRVLIDESAFFRWAEAQQGNEGGMAV